MIRFIRLKFGCVFCGVRFSNLTHLVKETSMSAPCSNATPDDEIMVRFARDLEAAEDPDTVIRAYCAGHPQTSIYNPPTGPCV